MWKLNRKKSRTERSRAVTDSSGGGELTVAKSKLVHIVDDVPELDEESVGGTLTMVQVLDGFLDAGNAAERASRALIEVSD